MMQETDKIIVTLKTEEENDYLIFNFDNPIKLNLNACSNDDLKQVFCKALKIIFKNNKPTRKVKI